MRSVCESVMAKSLQWLAWACTSWGVKSSWNEPASLSMSLCQLRSVFLLKWACMALTIKSRYLKTYSAYCSQKANEVQVLQKLEAFTTSKPTNKVTNALDVCLARGRMANGFGKILLTRRLHLIGTSYGHHDFKLCGRLCKVTLLSFCEQTIQSLVDSWFWGFMIFIRVTVQCLLQQAGQKWYLFFNFCRNHCPSPTITEKFTKIIPFGNQSFYRHAVAFTNHTASFYAPQETSSVGGTHTAELFLSKRLWKHATTLQG